LMSHIKLHRRPNPKTNLKAKTNPNRNLQKTEKKLEKRKKNNS